MSMLRRSAAATAVAAVILALAVAAVTAQVPPAAAPGPAGGIGAVCMNALMNMSDCLTYVESGSKTRHPQKPCCAELAGLVDSNPVCLCELLSGAADSYGISIDYTRALALPGVCHVTTPPVSTCTALGYHIHLGPTPAPMSGLSPASGGPQLPGASPPKAPNNAAGHFTAGNLVALAALPLAVASAAGMF